MDDLTLAQARALLTEFVAVSSSRDERIRAAVVAGLSVAEVARLLGIGRATVYRVINK